VYVVHSDWLLFHCVAYLSSFCDVKEKRRRTSEFQLDSALKFFFVTNLVEENLASRHVVRGSSVLRRVDSKSFTRIAIAAQQQHSY